MIATLQVLFLIALIFFAITFYFPWFWLTMGTITRG